MEDEGCNDGSNGMLRKRKREDVGSGARRRSIERRQLIQPSSHIGDGKQCSAAGCSDMDANNLLLAVRC